MEAATLKSKKQIKKGKLKKTIKNIICRPDPVFWPQTSEDEGKIIIEELNKLKLNIPHFKKPLWNELCDIPKKLRPKPPPIPKVEGLIFGLAESQKVLEIKECFGVLIEAGVNPKTIVQPLVETCTDKSVPVLCLKELRHTTKINYGIPTSVLAVKKNCLPELEMAILEIYKHHKPPKVHNAVYKDEDICTNTNLMEIRDNKNEFTTCPYLYRTDKKTRVFTPIAGDATDISNKFIGQNFIKLSNSLENVTMDRKQYMKMIVKKISSNPNRRKIAKVSPKD